MATKSEQIFKLIEAGYSKAEIDAIMMDNEVNTNNGENKTTPAQGVENSKATESKETATNDTKSTVSDDVSNVALLTAITNLTKVIQESNRNNTTTDGGANTPTQTAADILGSCLK